MPERRAAVIGCKSWTYQILRLKVDKKQYDSRHLIFVVFRATICMFDELYEIKSCFGGKNFNIIYVNIISSDFGK